MTAAELRDAEAKLRVVLLPRPHKRYLAGQLRADGYTLQQIADLFEISLGTAFNWTQQVQLFNNEKFTGRDGKARPPRYRPRAVTVNLDCD